MRSHTLRCQIYKICIIPTVLTFLSLFAFTHADEENEDNDSQLRVQEIQNRIIQVKSELQSRKSKNDYHFGKHEIDRCGGFVIKKPGKYTLKEDVFSKHAEIAITIRASDVVINLNNHTLSGQNKSTIGILAVNTSNLIIQNGTLRNFTINGIKIDPSSNIVLDNLLILQNGNVSGPPDTGGLAIFNSSYIDINNVNLNENFNFGLGMSGVNNVNFINSNSDGTKGIASGTIFGNEATGILVSSTGGNGSPFVYGSSNLNFINSTVNNTTAGDSAFGIFIDSLGIGVSVNPNSNVIIENCAVNNTTQTNVTPTSGALAPFAEGITMAGGFDVTIKNCTVDTLSAAATTDLPASHIVGIEVAGTNNALIDSCTVSNATAIANYVHGFDIEGSGNNITFTNCIAYMITNNSSNSSHLALGFGILKPLGIPSADAVGIGTVVKNSIAQNVHGPNGATAAGLLLNAQKNVVIEYNIFNNSDNGILANDIATGENPALVSSNGLIRGNVTDGNTFFGISDLTSANNAYYGNTARANGTSNFNNLPPNTPIVVWTIGSPPIPSHGFVLDNYSIMP